MTRRGRSPAPARAASPRFSSPTPRTTLPAKTYQQTAPARPPPAPAAPAVAAPQQPSMFGQMAATAGGVAVGSAVGHTIGHAMTGLFSGGKGEQVAEQQQQQAAPMHHSQANPDENGPCAWEIKQFLQCAANQDDLTLCQGFNEAVQQCKMRYSM